MHRLCLPVLLLVFPGAALAAPDGEASSVRLARDDRGVVRLLLNEDGRAVRVPVARGGTPEGFLHFRRHGAWWLLLAYPDRIVAGRSETIEGPYLDHRDRTLLDGGGTLVAGGLALDVARTIGPLETGDLADALCGSDGVRPVVWPPDGFPVAGPVGTLPSWRGNPAVAWPFPGPWRHRADFGAPTRISPLEGGAIAAQPGGVSWRIEGAALTLTWPRGDAPDGAWVDRCLLSRDGRHYLGRNQWQTAITGELELADSVVARHTRLLPLALLPAGAIAPTGKLSLWADYGAAADERVPVYVVNRTGATVTFPAQDGDIYLKLRGRTAKGTWARAETHAYSWCGNSYIFEPELPADRCFVVLAWFPSEGYETEVRYRIAEPVEVISNVGRGRVHPSLVEICRSDRMALRRGDFTTVSEVALGEVRPRAEDRLDLRVFAVEQMVRFGMDPRTGNLLRNLLSDPDPDVRAAARRTLEAIE